MRKIGIKNIDKYLYGIFDISILLVLVNLFVRNSFVMIVSVFLLFITNVIFSIKDIQKHVIFVGFNVSFFFFLLGRFIVTGIFGVDFEYAGLYDMGFSNKITVEVITLLAISMLVYTVTYWLLECDYKQYSKIEESLIFGLFYRLTFRLVEKFKSKLPNKRLVDKDNKKKIFDESFIKCLRSLALIIFLITIMLRIYVLFMKFNSISQIGYSASYMLDNSELTLFERLIDIVSRMELIAYIVFIATKPKIKHSILPSILFIIPGVLSLLIGGRSEIVLRFMLLVVYYIFMINNKKLLRKIVISMLIMLPIFILVFIIIDFYRGTENAALYGSDSILSKVLRLFYKQGVSARVIGSTILFGDDLPNKMYSFSTISDFIKYSVLGRIQGFPEPVGQSVDVALNKAQLSHIITFYQSPYEYLNKGLGAGSSYVAELFFDFGYVGVIIGSAFYGFIMKYLRKGFESGNILIVIVSLSCIKNMFFTPRSSFSFFLVDILNDTQLATLILLFIMNIVIVSALKRMGIIKHGN